MENFYWPNWVETFLKWKRAKAIYDRKTLGKRQNREWKF